MKPELIGAVILGCLLATLIAVVPGLVATHRRLPNARSVGWLGVIGILLPPVWLVALCWAFLAPGKPKPAGVKRAPLPKSSRDEAADFVARAVDHRRRDEVQRILRRR